ncbi:hypothetical protein [Streptomyces huiliensis]|uniref:hypothetical protein n=1 Tax=Streptomyces huiliensis TaxID=2876027 RepID=UPI001CBB15AC|nr:hypothetical protein [Streptomyces huiliensis]MBZ4318358.1 hypothetical protein [Streptomyces huiliensis]
MAGRPRLSFEAVVALLIVVIAVGLLVLDRAGVRFPSLPKSTSHERSTINDWHDPFWMQRHDPFWNQPPPMPAPMGPYR